MRCSCGPTPPSSPDPSTYAAPPTKGGGADGARDAPKGTSKHKGKEGGGGDKPDSVAQADSGAKLLSGGLASPVQGGEYKFLGGPHQGTHTLGNWESDNAIDMGVKSGTPIYAVSDGTIANAKGNNDDPSSRFNGFNFELAGSGNAWFYTHLSKSLVKSGDHVKAGQLIGYSGAANGVEHLHIGQRDGDPTKTIAKGS